MGCAGFRQHMKINYRWVLEWPSMEPGFEDKQEIRKGVDVIHSRTVKSLTSSPLPKQPLKLTPSARLKSQS